jgi:hypothetical protein
LRWFSENQRDFRSCILETSIRLEVDFDVRYEDLKVGFQLVNLCFISRMSRDDRPSFFHDLFHYDFGSLQGFSPPFLHALYHFYGSIVA